MEGDKVTKIKLLPIRICPAQKPYNMAGVPLPADPMAIYNQLVYASKPYGVEFGIDGDIIRVKL